MVENFQVVANESPGESLHVLDELGLVECSGGKDGLI